MKSPFEYAKEQIDNIKANDNPSHTAPDYMMGYVRALIDNSLVSLEQGQELLREIEILSEAISFV